MPTAETETKTKEQQLYQAADEGNETQVRALLAEVEVNINYQGNIGGSTPLYIAAEKGHLEIVNLLLGKRAKVNLARSDGMTPLYIATVNKRDAVVSRLLDAGAAVDQSPHTNGKTPLFAATEQGNLALVKVLLGAGAKVTQEDRQGTTTPSLSYAKAYGYTEIANLLLVADAATTIAEFREALQGVDSKEIQHCVLQIAQTYQRLKRAEVPVFFGLFHRNSLNKQEAVGKLVRWLKAEEPVEPLRVTLDEQAAFAETNSALNTIYAATRVKLTLEAGEAVATPGISPSS